MPSGAAEHTEAEEADKRRRQEGLLAEVRALGRMPAEHAVSEDPALQEERVLAKRLWRAPRVPSSAMPDFMCFMQHESSSR